MHSSANNPQMSGPMSMMGMGGPGPAQPPPGMSTPPSILPTDQGPINPHLYNALRQGYMTPGQAMPPGGMMPPGQGMPPGAAPPGNRVARGPATPTPGTPVKRGPAGPSSAKPKTPASKPPVNKR